MGRGINSGLIEIRPGPAQKYDAAAVGAWAAARNKEKTQNRSGADPLTAVYASNAHCADLCDRAARDADNGRTLAR